MTGSHGLLSCRFLWVVLLIIAVVLPAQAGDEWLPIPPEDLALKDNPASPGAHAMILWRETDRDDVKAVASYYYRVKIFTEEGKKYADVKISYNADWYDIEDIKARTVHPDGRVVTFQGDVFDKPLAKSRRYRWMAKTFTLPDVQVGSIIEYRFKVRWSDRWLYPSSWDVQQELFTRRAHFRIRPYRGRRSLVDDNLVSASGFEPRRYTFAYVGRLAGEQRPNVQEDGTVELEMENIPAFENEPFMPPAEMLTMRVRFFYSRHQVKTVEEFWRKEAAEWRKDVNKFVGKPESLEKEVAGILTADDSPESALRKLYARAQQIRNLSFEPRKTEQEQQREKLRDNKNARDVLEHGYGYRREINRLFVALARAAGFNASVVRIAERDETFFQPRVLDWSQLNGEVALVQLDARELYLDPGTPYCPFGLLSWEKTAVQGLSQAESTVGFLATPDPNSSDSIVRRTSTLSLDGEGTLRGTLEVAYFGQEALDRRLGAMRKDEAGRRRELEEEVMKWLPAGATVKVLSVEGWEETEKPLQVQAAVEIPGLVVSTGRRLLLPLGLFQTTRTHPFRHAERLYPVYFRYPFQEVDEISIELPEGYRVETVPRVRHRKRIYAQYKLTCEHEGNRLRIGRRRAIDKFLIPTNFYGRLRSFYNYVRTGDEEVVVLEKVEVGQQR